MLTRNNLDHVTTRVVSSLVVTGEPGPAGPLVALRCSEERRRGASTADSRV